MSSYPAQTRYVKRACERLGYRFRELDEGGGYLFAVSDGTRAFVSGSGAICTWPLNSAPAFGISRDKHHTNAVLAHAGIPIIPGELFFLQDHMAKLRGPGRERADAIATFARKSPPLFCKPNQGSRGDFAEIVADLAAFENYLVRVATRYDAILLQPVLDGDEYRVFTLDGEALYSARKAEVTLRGDGTHSLAELMQLQNAAVAGTGVSPLDPRNVLEAIALRHGLQAHHVPATGKRILLPGRRNFSAGGDVEGFTTDVPAPLASLARKSARAIGLRVAGVDIFDVSPLRDLSESVVIEVNGNPGIQTLEALGRNDLIDEIWKTVLTRFFGEAAA